MPIRPEVIPFMAAVLVIFSLPAMLLCGRLRTPRRALLLWLAPSAVCAVFLLFFFRDPERVVPADPAAVVAGADGRVAALAFLRENAFLKADCVRISIFLSLLDVHVNRAPIAGESVFLGYFPGKRFFTFQEKSSDANQHNKILITGGQTRCLVHQIVGPVCRRVVYWLPHDRPEKIAMGERIGMMKFGSRLDMYLPASDVDVLCKPGDTVRAGETTVARLKRDSGRRLIGN